MAGLQGAAGGSLEDVWKKHLNSYQEGTLAPQGGERKGPPPPRPGDWICGTCWPKVNNFASKAVCYKCGASKPPPGAPPPGPPVEAPGINFGVRGDSFLQTKHDTAKLKKYRTFKPDFESAFWEVFGNCNVDYEIIPGEPLGAITQCIANGPSFDILCVGIGIQDLMDPVNWDKIAPCYPPTLDQELQNLAQAIKSKAGGSMVWLGAHAEFWGRQPAERWDAYCEHARNTLRTAGVKVVPGETIAFVMNQMSLAKDEVHISNNEHEKEIFAKAWATCLYAAASDPTWGLTVTGPQAGIFEEKGKRARSRSPPERQFNPFSAYGKGYGK